MTKITSRARRYRFPIYSFQEITAMSATEWEEICRLCGADMEPHPEETPGRTDKPLGKCLSVR